MVGQHPIRSPATPSCLGVLQYRPAKKLEYPLPATTFTKAECDAMQSRILRTALPYSGVVRSFPRVVVHGPKRYLGLAIPHPYTTQGIQQVMRAVIFSSAKRSSGHLFRCSAETMKLEKGMNGPLLSPDFYSYDVMITESWWKALWGFLARYGMSMHDDIPDFPLYRVNDSCIMSEFIAKGYKGSNLCCLNACREYLQVIRYSDLLDASGGHFLPEFLTGNEQCGLNTDYKWPVRGRPYASDWEFWKEAVYKTFGQNGGTTPKPAGPWKTRPAHWKVFVSCDLNTLYVSGKDRWNSYTRLPTYSTR
jgi:hypothetical protein